MRGKITTRSLQGARSRVLKDAGRSSAVFLWDTQTKGFGCRVSPSGHVSWVFQHWIGGRGGKAKRVSFGEYPSLSITDARSEAIRLRGEASEGVEIVSPKKSRITKQKQDLQAPLLGALVDQYLDERTQEGRYWQEVRRVFNVNVLPVLGHDTPITHITKANIQRLIRSRKKTPGAQRTLYEMLNPFMSWCVDEEYISESPMTDVKPPKVLKARDRVLNDDEIRLFWDATGYLGWPFGPFYRVLLLTGQRRDEVAGIRWSEIDDDTWTLPSNRTKNGKQHIVHLSPLALHVLHNETVRLSDNADLIFTTNTKAPIAGFSKAKRKLDELMGDNIESFRIHDLRRTAASGMARLGIEPHVIERILNHTSGVTGGLISVYQRYEYLDERKQSLNAWAKHLEALNN